MGLISGLRFPIAVALGFFLTSGMFYTLWKLTNVSFDIEANEAIRIEFTRTRTDTETQTRREEKVEREPPPPTPEMPSISASASNVGGATVNLAPVVDTAGAMSNLNISAGSDRDIQPLVRINPEYPPRAEQRQQEGWVTVQFTITETGSVVDVVAIDASPKGVFDDAAIKAVQRWRYNPKVENGTAVARKGVRTLLTFKLADE
jgi:periplasmic protein TonB